MMNTRYLFKNLKSIYRSSKIADLKILILKLFLTSALVTIKSTSNPKSTTLILSKRQLKMESSNPISSSLSLTNCLTKMRTKLKDSKYI